MANHDPLPGSGLSLAAKLGRVGWPLIAVLSALAVAGAVALYSVAGGSISPWAEQHVMRFLLMVAVLLAIAVLPIQIWAALAYPAFGLALVLLALVPLVGVEAMGARRWLSIAGMSLQPSELMKVALVVMLARYYQWLPPEKVSRPLWVAVPVVLITVPVVLTLRQPDLGTAVLFAAVGVTLMFLAGVSPLYAVGVGFLVWLLAPFVWDGLHDYQKRRVEIFLDPDKDPLGAGYHISQSKIALGSGGTTGRGYMQGTQSALDFLPEKHTDFIFTMLGEEWGFIGTIAVVTLYGCALFWLAVMALRCRSQFARLLVAGALMVLFVYASINIAMVTGLVPVVGVPLPLVSYGGTSMVSIMVALGLAMSAYVHRDHTFRRREFRWFW